MVNLKGGPSYGQRTFGRVYKMGIWESSWDLWVDGQFKTQSICLISYVTAKHLDNQFNIKLADLPILLDLFFSLPYAGVLGIWESQFSHMQVKC